MDADGHAAQGVFCGQLRARGNDDDALNRPSPHAGKSGALAEGPSLWRWGLCCAARQMRAALLRRARFAWLSMAVGAMDEVPGQLVNAGSAYLKDIYLLSLHRPGDGVA